jgi:hypothetical protein
MASPHAPAASARATGGGEVLPLVAGFVLAVLATLAIFLTDNPQYLRVAVLAAAWAFVLAAVAAGQRRSDRVAAAAREAELRRSHQRELEHEEAAHREYELELENELRAQLQESVRHELDALRQEVAALAARQGDPAGLAVLRDQLASLPALRDEVARVSALRSDVAALSALRADVAALSSLRPDLASLAALRGELGQVADLRADLDRLRSELTEQLSSELLVERIRMRTQGSSGGAAPGGPADPAWGAEGLGRTEPAPRELTGGWPLHLDEALGTREYDRVRAERFPSDPAPASPPSWRSPATEPAGYPAAGGHWSPETVESSLFATPADLPADTGSSHSRHAAEPPHTTEVPTLSGERPRPQPFPRHDRALEPSDLPPPNRAGFRPPVPPAATASAPDAETGPVWVSEIIAANGGGPRATGRRRRRYRDEDTQDDVLNRVLGRD